MTIIAPTWQYGAIQAGLGTENMRDKGQKGGQLSGSLNTCGSLYPTDFMLNGKAPLMKDIPFNFLMALWWKGKQH